MSDDLEIFIPPEALENVDLSIPGDFELEIMAGELVSYLTSYHTAFAGQRAARQQEDNQRAEQLGKQVAFTRMAAAYVQHMHPKAKALADQIMSAQATQIKKTRGTNLNSARG